MNFKTAVLTCLIGLSLVATVPVSYAADEQIVPTEARVKAISGKNEGIYFDGKFSLDLSDEAREVLERGITLNFLLEVEVEKPRWYWANKDIGVVKENIRLSYNPMTRQYRVNIGGMKQNFENLSSAIQLMSTISNLFISPYMKLESSFEAKARFYLDISKLPKPFQATLKKDNGWNLDTGWFKVKIEQGED